MKQEEGKEHENSIVSNGETTLDKKKIGCHFGTQAEVESTILNCINRCIASGSRVVTIPLHSLLAVLFALILWHLILERILLYRGCQGFGASKHKSIINVWKHGCV